MTLAVWPIDWFVAQYQAMRSGALTGTDWLVVGAYLLVVFLVGLIFTRRAGRNTSEFFLSGRNLPWWLAGTSMVATAFSSDTPLVVTGWVRQGGIAGNWMWWSFAIGGMFSALLLSKLWRRAEVVTMVELTEMRYSGKSAAVLRGIRGAYFALPISCVAMAWSIVAMIKVFTVLLGIDPLPAVVLCITVTTIYTAFAGSWGVVVTDFIQFIVAMFGSIVLCVLAMRQVGGIQGLRDGSGLKPALFDFFPRPGGNVEILSTQFLRGMFGWEFWYTAFGTFTIYMLVQWWANKNADGGAVVVQRMSSTKNEQHSLLATLWFNVANYAVKPWPWILVALASLVVFPGLGDKQEDAYPLMIKKLMSRPAVPAGLIGLMVAAFMAAFMSMINTFLNLSSSFLVQDVYKRFVRRSATEKHYVLVSRLSSVLVMAVSATVALEFQSISGLFKFLLAFASGIGSVYIAKWFWWRVSAWSEIAAMIASSVISSGLYIWSAWQAKHSGPAMPEAVILTLTAVISTVIWVTVTFMTAPVEREKLVSFYRKVRPYGFWGDIAAASGVKPPRDLWKLLLAWLAGTLTVLGATIAVGKLLLGFYLDGAIWAALAVAGSVVVWQTVLRSGHPSSRSE